MSDKSTVPMKWADPAMFEAEKGFDWGESTGVVPKVYLLSMSEDPLGVIAAMALMYEGKVVRSLADVTNDQRRKALADVQQTHLQAPLEAVKLHFMIEGVDRGFTHQLVRQRTAVYAQESMRFAVVDDLIHSTTLPPSLMGTELSRSFFEVPDEGPMATATFNSLTMLRESNEFKYATTQERHRAMWDWIIQNIDEVYGYLVNDGMPAEDARGLLPHCTATRTNYVTDLRNLIAHAGNRLCTQAQFHWRSVFSQIVQQIADYGNSISVIETTTLDDRFRSYEPGSRRDGWQFTALADSGMFKPVCYQLGHCPFKASFDRACSIRDRVDAGQFDKIRTAEWLVDPTAAR